MSSSPPGVQRAQTLHSILFHIVPYLPISWVGATGGVIPAIPGSSLPVQHFCLTWLTQNADILHSWKIYR